MKNKIRKLKKYSDHDWRVSGPISHERGEYYIIEDGASRYVMEEDNITDVDQLLSGEISYSEWCNHTSAILCDKDLPDGLEEQIKADWTRADSPVCSIG